jgi:hypothetical protein
VRAMNQIKEYYIGKIPNLKSAFAWRGNSTPAKFKAHSVGFYMVLQVALLGSVSLGAAVYFVIQAIWNMIILWPGITVGIVFAALQLYQYRRMLK